MGCCICACCLSEDSKIQRVLLKFDVTRASQLRPNDTKIVVGRVVLVGQALMAPVSRKPCVYYEVLVEEYVQNGDERYWKQLFREIRGTDFLLVDPPGHSAYIPAGSVAVKFYAQEDTIRGQSGGWMFHNHAHRNPDITALLQRNGVSECTNVLGMSKHRELRYREGCFDVNEMVGIFGKASATVHNGLNMMRLEPCNQRDLSKDECMRRGWTDLEYECWLKLTASPALLGTDDHKYLRGVDVPPLIPTYNFGAALMVPTPVMISGGPMMQPTMIQQPQPMIIQQTQPVIMQSQPQQYMMMPQQQQMTMQPQPIMIPQQPAYQQQPLYQQQQPLYQQQPVYQQQQPAYNQVQPINGYPQNQGFAAPNNQNVAGFAIPNPQSNAYGNRIVPY